MIPIIFAVFGDMDSAAIAALTLARDCPRQYECGGVIYEDSEHHYHVSAPLTSHKPFGVDILQYSEPTPDGWRIVADYHTHICSPHNRLFANFFSASDAYVNQGFHTVGYMLSFCDGNVRRYDPSQDDRDDEVVHFTSGREIYLTCGHIAGWIDTSRPSNATWKPANGYESTMLGANRKAIGPSRNISHASAKTGSTKRGIADPP
jgi:hypothetical protein